jgi:hypothetical protein
MARPTKYTEALARQICSKLSEGKSLASICKSANMPSAVSVYAWMQKMPEFLKMYETAKAESADHLAEEIVEIADNTEGDTQRDRLRMDARKWVAARLKPNKYGDKVTTEHQGNVAVEGKWTIEVIEPK